VDATTAVAHALNAVATLAVELAPSVVVMQVVPPRHRLAVLRLVVQLSAELRLPLAVLRLVVELRLRSAVWTRVVVLLPLVVAVLLLLVVATKVVAIAVARAAAEAAAVRACSIACLLATSAA
jgi:hypothetical protein